MKKRTFRLVILLMVMSLLTICFPALADNAEYIWTAHDGICQFRSNGKIGLMNEAHEVLVKAKYDFIDPRYTEGITIVRNGDKYGVIDLQGNEIVKPKYGRIFPMKNGRMIVQSMNGNKYGYIDKTGNVLIDPDSDYYCKDAYDFNKYGFALVNRSNQVQVIDGSLKAVFKIDRGLVDWVEEHNGWYLIKEVNKKLYYIITPKGLRIEREFTGRYYPDFIFSKHDNGGMCYNEFSYMKNTTYVSIDGEVTEYEGLPDKNNGSFFCLLMEDDYIMESNGNENNVYSIRNGEAQCIQSYTYGKGTNLYSCFDTYPVQDSTVEPLFFVYQNNNYRGEGELKLLNVINATEIDCPMEIYGYFGYVRGEFQPLGWSGFYDGLCIVSYFRGSYNEYSETGINTLGIINNKGQLIHEFKDIDWHVEYLDGNIAGIDNHVYGNSGKSKNRWKGYLNLQTGKTLMYANTELEDVKRNIMPYSNGVFLDYGLITLGTKEQTYINFDGETVCGITQKTFDSLAFKTK